MAERRIIVSALRGSGGAYTHLSRVLPLLMAREPEWRFELYSCRDALLTMFGTTDEPWMHVVLDGRGARLRWEFMELPYLLERDQTAIVYSPFGPLQNLSLGRRTVHMSHNILPLLPSEELEISDADRPRIVALRYQYVLAARVARKVICVSRHARERLASLSHVSPEHMAVVPHGADPPLDKECSDDRAERTRKSSYMLHVGGAIAYRHTRELILAYARLRPHRTHMPTLVLVGSARGEDAAYERECLELLAPLVRDGAALHLPTLPREDVLALTHHAHTIVYPSMAEDCPNVVLEALAAGKVSVFGDIPAARELAGDAAIYAGRASCAEIAAGMAQAIDDAGLRARLSVEAKTRARLFTWERAAAGAHDALG